MEHLKMAIERHTNSRGRRPARSYLQFCENKTSQDTVGDYWLGIYKKILELQLANIQFGMCYGVRRHKLKVVLIKIANCENRLIHDHNEKSRMAAGLVRIKKSIF